MSPLHGLFLLLLPLSRLCADLPGGDPRHARKSPVVLAVERTGPAVVNISTEQIVTKRFDPFYGLRDRFSEPLFRDFFSRFGHQQQVRTHSLGSGVILDQDGYIVTNEHVIRKASQIRILLVDKTEVEASLVSSDPENDMAVLKIPPSPKLVAAPIGTSSDLMIGETAIALGNPFGLEHSVSVGVISAKNRSIIADGEVVYSDFIQTDAAVNPGNSGGPLLNIHGEVIGINTAIYAEGQGISFAIPIDKVVSTLEALLDYRVLKEIWVGLQLQRLSPELARNMDVQGEGLIVAQVEKDSPAGKAGFVPSDLIRRVDGQPVTTLLDFNKKILRHEQGEAVTVDYVRDGRNQQAQLTLAALPAPSEMEMARKRLGLQVQSVNPQLGKRLGLRVEQGLLITELEKGGPAHAAGLRTMDVIVQIDRFRIQSTEELGRLLHHFRTGSRIQVIIVRGDVIGRAVLGLR
ncbi:MAG: trypsin-like peptidase domain-containing protein [Planctomycetes bacterium]|nr:trypsin-like peptidase domain-containing protein [Planctomycetota bacterium]